MDDFTLHILQGFLPDPFIAFLQDHILSASSPLQLVKRNLLASIYGAAATIYPLLAPILDRVAAALYNSPDIVLLVFVLVVLFVAVQILAWIKRVMVWWTRLVARLVFWAGMIAVGAAIWQRGAEQSARDAVVVGSKIVGYAAVVKDIWLREYQRYEAQGSGQHAGHGSGNR